MVDHSRGAGIGGPMASIIAGFLGLLTVIAIVVLGPVLAGSMQAAVPNLSASSSWNVTANTKNSKLKLNSVSKSGFELVNLPTGVAIWTTKKF